MQGHIPPGWSCGSEIEAEPARVPFQTPPTSEARPEGSRGCAVLRRRPGRPARFRQCVGGSLATSAVAAAADPVLCVLLTRVTVACFLWPLCPAHTTLGPRTLSPWGFRPSRGGRGRVPAVGHQDTPPLPFSVHSLQWPFSSCTHDPVHGRERVRVKGCLTWMRPPTRVNNYRITSIFIAFLLR